jgi:hypothetical protein
MGNTCRGTSRDKTRNDSLIKIKTQNDNCYYKPRLNSSSLLCLDPEKKRFREEILDSRSSFRKGCMFTKLGPGLYILIGGQDTSEAWIIHLNEKKMTSLPPAPHSLSFGQLNKFKDRIYITGALITEGRPAPPYYFDLKLKKWGELPKLPVEVALSGSYIVHTFLYLIGGFLDYPSTPRFFDSFLIYDIPADCWVESMIKTPLQVALPSCITLANSTILIIGGYDPMGLTLIENTKVHLFDGKNFENCADLPLQGTLRFSHNGFNLRSEIFLFSEDDILFIYKVENDEWTFQHASHHK